MHSYLKSMKIDFIHSFIVFLFKNFCNEQGDGHKVKPLESLDLRKSFVSVVTMKVGFNPCVVLLLQLTGTGL